IRGRGTDACRSHCRCRLDNVAPHCPRAETRWRRPFARPTDARCASPIGTTVTDIRCCFCPDSVLSRLSECAAALEQLFGCGLGRLDRPRQAREPEAAGALDRGHREDVPGVAGGGLEADQLLDERRHLHLLEQIEIVVLLLPVRPETDRYATGPHVRNAGDAR